MSYNPNPPAQTIQSAGTNNTGSSFAQLTPVMIKSDGSLGTVSVSVEADIQSLAGVASTAIAASASGNVASSGRVFNIGNAYAYGTQLYISSTGGVTSAQPTIGVNGFVAGDFVVSLGVVAQNATNPSQYDFIVRIDLVGQL